MQLSFLLGFILLTSCDPVITRPATDVRSAKMVESKWTLYSGDSMYISNGSPVYIERMLFTSCTETLYFQVSMELTRKDSCSGQDATVLQGNWYWPLNDSLTASFPVSGHTFKSLRFTDDTLQFFDINVAPADTINNKPVYFVKTYVRS